MALTLTLRWMLDGAEIDPRIIALLEAIARRGSLQKATAEVGLSYRHAWELLGRLEALLGEHLVHLERGRGATLTAYGAHLAEGVRAIDERLQPELQRSADALNRASARNAAPAGATLSICASHDLALGALAEMLKRSRTEVELHSQGSVDALISLARKRCDIAGFHVPHIPGRAALVEPYRPWLKGRSLRLVHFADRQQGLIVAKGNPLGIAKIADLVKSRARFVNRQPGSGTRLFFDAVLATARIRPAQINGYRNEEFTHAAVAALIASGAADAGFGIEAAAVQQGLDFVPMASERYFLAAREATLARAGPQCLLKMLASRAFRTAAGKLGGYVLPARVEAVSVREALESASGATYTTAPAFSRTPTRKPP